STSVPILKIEISNTFGQIIYSKELKDKSATVDVSKFAKGSYIAKIHTTQGINNMKFIVK
ncbi:MAG: T9SS type A sorting domain-containing protein, partial [Bacteroidales bacterium]|nr:T9SS type A sorting domain-containing protein [Bacteroidales bacterium]